MEIMGDEINNWLSLLTRGGALKSFFNENNIRSIAIYGMGELGTFLYNDVIRFGIKVKFCIDKNKKKYNNHEILHPMQIKNIHGIDLIVICISHNRHALKEINNILKDINFQYMTLLEIIQLCYYKQFFVPHCKSLGVRPYFVAYPFQRELHNLSATERALATIAESADYYKSNPAYFKDIYQTLDEYSNEYIKAVYTQSPLIDKGDFYIHSDLTSQYVNIIQGKRFTHYVPELYEQTIHLIGTCVALGYGVDDSRTIASYLQKMLTELPDDSIKYRVVNHGLWGSRCCDPEKTFNKLCSIPYTPGDIIVISFDLTEIHRDYCMDYFRRALNNDYHSFYDLYEDFCKPRGEHPLYIDWVHLSFWGMKRFAKSLYHLFKEEGLYQRKDNLKLGLSKQISNSSSECAPPTTKSLTRNKSLNDYIDFLNTHKRRGIGHSGAIVMNCNPFTMGHRYLIELASQQVEVLYIFIVEEDKSLFPFKDRIELVKLGTNDLKNIVVLPSGKFIISTITFPEYFIKDSLNEVIIDPSKDIEIFAQSIAPILNINKRFVGQEPFDPITRQYNQSMKDLLPPYGIELIEFDRVPFDKIPISASRVRKLLIDKNWDELSNIVPETTLNYLMSSKNVIT